MVTEMITLKLNNLFLQEIDSLVKKEGYQNRTEFIRNALREKVEEIKIKKAMMELAYLKGKAKKKVSNKDYEKARISAFEKLSNKMK